LKNCIIAQGGLVDWLIIIKKLSLDINLNVKFILGSDQGKSDANKYFPDTYYYKNSFAKNCYIPKELGNLISQDKTDIFFKKLDIYKNNYLKMLDRFNADGSLSIKKRLLFFNNHAIFWRNLIQKKKINLVFFRIAPHQAYDFLLYAVCRIMKVKTVMFEKTNLPNLIFPVKSYENVKDEIDKIKSSEKISNDNNNFLRKVNSNYNEGMPPHVRFKLKKFQGGNYPTFFRHIVKKLPQLIVNLFFKKYRLNTFNRFIFEIINLQRNKRIYKFYIQNSKIADLTKKFIFVALQCEPERQSNPQGGSFFNQLKMIEYLSYAVPKDYLIYVKEHISQFKSFQNCSLSKNEEFYKKIIKLKNVCLINFNYNSFELIDKSRMVALVSGSVGFESFVRKTNVLLFGYAWYESMHGIYKVSKVTDIKKAIKSIDNLEKKITDQKIFNFISKIEKVSANAFLDELGVDNKISTLKKRNQNITNVIKVLKPFILRNYVRVS